MKTKAILLLILAGLLLAGAATASAQDNVLTLYTRRCASCHGPDGAGKTAAAARMKMPDLRSAQIQGMSDNELFETIGRGTNHKTYPHVFLQTGMSDSQVRSIVNFVRMFAKK